MHKITLKLYCIDPHLVYTIARSAAIRNGVQYLCSENTIQFTLSGNANNLKSLPKAAGSVQQKLVKEKIAFESKIEIENQAALFYSKEDNERMLEYEATRTKIAKDKVY